MPFDVVVIGNIGIDTNVYFPYGDYSPDLESAFTENLDYIGQAGGYTARGYARLGYSTAFIGYVGDDCLGRFIREQLNKDGINTDALFVDPAGTCRSINMMRNDGRRKNFYDAKSHMTLQPDMARCKAVLRGARLAHVHLPNWARTLLPILRENGVFTACDLQDVVDPNDEYRRDFVRNADALFFSSVNHTDPEPLMRTFRQRGPARVLVSGLGAEGCALSVDGRLRCFPPVNMDRPVVDTNGAGDGLAVGFLSGYVLEGLSPEESVQRGQTVARFTCAQKADTDHLITRAELNALIRRS